MGAQHGRGRVSAPRGPSSASLVTGDAEYHLGESMQGAFKSLWKMDSEDKFILVQESISNPCKSIVNKGPNGFYNINEKPHLRIYARK